MPCVQIRTVTSTLSKSQVQHITKYFRHIIIKALLENKCFEKVKKKFFLEDGYYSLIF